MATIAAVSEEVRATYEAVIGLEVHVQLLTATKAFCGCSTQFGAAPNTNVCPVCLGMPGALPVLNRKARASSRCWPPLALNCRVSETSIFARKNYFYPDLPKGYQISQYDKPLAEHGYIEIKRPSNGKKKIGITRAAHGRGRRQEPARRAFPTPDRRPRSISTAPACRSSRSSASPTCAPPDEAYEYLTKLKEIILYTGVSDCNMEEGSLRCDANVSVRPRGSEKFGTKAEVKNVNSFRFIREALEYEIQRQFEVIESGGNVKQETRLYNSAEGRTYAMRSKEQAHDYRYFPEPDLLPLVVDPRVARRGRSRACPSFREARRAAHGARIRHH